MVLDRHGVYGLQKNLLVENIIDIYKQQQESRGGDGKETPLKDKDGKEPKCKEQDEHINSYCISCQLPTCSMCKVFEQHKDCKVSPLQAVYQSQKNNLHSAVELLAAGNSCIQAVMAEMDDTRKLIQENAELKKRRLGESFDLLYAVLEERKGQLLEHISRVEQEKVSELRMQADQYQQQLQLSNQLQEKLLQTMQTCSAAEFLFTAKQLQEEARQAAQAAQLEMPEPGYMSLQHLSVDTQKAKAVLAHMGFRQWDYKGNQDGK